MLYPQNVASRYDIAKLSLSSSFKWASAIVDKKFLGFLSNMFFKSPALTHQLSNRIAVGHAMAHLSPRLFG